MDFLYGIDEVQMASYKSAKDFIDHQFPYVEVETTDKFDDAIFQLLSGKSILFIDGYNEIIFVDLRSYPTRSTEEPEKEKEYDRNTAIETIKLIIALGYKIEK